ncbi:hypothetical protein OCU04_000907 [Sclerotinia nivalis]|uniref:Uncharacterized protein n=1 Tax=Sclerotinia nivalis TaxID=352851 RepID=A0A9X0DRL3_9HELO|nr:hypothetical protein OCU04_000907 [Sclerotinia nivalis]
MAYVYTQWVDASGMLDFEISLLIVCIGAELKGSKCINKIFPNGSFFKPPDGVDTTILESYYLSWIMGVMRSRFLGCCKDSGSLLTTNVRLLYNVCVLYRYFDYSQ